MTEKEKIIEILKSSIAWEYVLYKCKDILYENNFEQVADALIENGIGDIAEWKEKLDIAEKAGKIIQRDMYSVFGTNNLKIKAQIDNLWELAKRQAKKEIEEEQYNEQD